jgi:energy-coupling factor transporter transmembrane protein EcfT
MMRRWIHHLNPTAILLLLLALCAFAWVAIPIVLIQPFAPQTRTEVAWSYALKSRAPWVTAAILAAAILVTVLRRRRLRGGGSRTVAAVALLLLGGTAWLATRNHFEWMFHPIPEIGFAPVAEADWVDPQDFVLGVVVGDTARAYPVRALAYHHVVNDVVGDEPIVATY